MAADSASAQASIVAQKDNLKNSNETFEKMFDSTFENLLSAVANDSTLLYSQENLRDFLSKNGYTGTGV
nr:MAG TPA: hypothetical protein [Caudoviricetes sp.]